MREPERLMRTIIGHCDEVADYQGDRWCRTHTNTLVDGICPKADATLDLIRARDAEVAARALRDAAEAMRMVSEPTMTLLPAQDADETWYSPDVWLDHEADWIEKGETDE